MRKKFLKRIKPLFFVFPLVGAISLSSCSSSTDNDKYYVGQGVMDSQYNHSSEITDTLKKMTVSLGFEYHKNNSDVIKKDIQKVSGTGWIYKIDGNDYYFATNLHVASSYSFKATVSNNDKQSSSLFNYMISTSIKFIPPNAQKNEVHDFYDKNQLLTVYTSFPKIVYTTTTDDEYNNLFGKVYGQIKGEAQPDLYQAITDIAILKYTLPENENEYKNNANKRDEILNRKPTTNTVGIDITGISDFIEWLKISKEEQSVIPVLSQNFDDYNKKKYSFKYYMGGFPSENARIGWRGYSDFNLNYEITSRYENSFELYKDSNQSVYSETIQFLNNSSNLDDPTTYNFVSAGKEGYFYAHSAEGASGSPIVTIINNKPYIVGIYWGLVTFNVRGVERHLGAADFLSSKSANKIFNLKNNIDKKINALTSH